MTATAAGLGAVALLAVLAGFLAAVETVLTRLGVVRALRLDEEGRRGAAQLLWLLEHPARALNVVLFLTVGVWVAGASMLAVVVVAAGTGTVLFAAAALAIVFFVAAEVAPRTYTLRHLERVGLVTAPAAAAVVRLLRPLVRVLVAAGSRLAGRPAAGPFTSDEELRRLIGTADEEQTAEIEEDERAMIHSIFELGDTVVREIMVPRPDMTMVPFDASLPEVVETVIARGYSRVPVYQGSRENIVGIVYAKDLLHRLYLNGGAGGARGGASWADLLREPTFVPESKRADDLLRELQRQKVHLAIVVDEYGAVVGLVTIEDILEEIVGEIVDEFDHEEPPVVRLDERRLRVSARVTVHDLNELLGVTLPEDEGWDTVGGLLIGMLGRVPAAGEATSVDGVTLVAERVQGRRVSKVLVMLPPEETAVAGTAS